MANRRRKRRPPTNRHVYNAGPPHGYSEEDSNALETVAKSASLTAWRRIGIGGGAIGGLGMVASLTSSAWSFGPAHPTQLIVEYTAVGQAWAAVALVGANCTLRIASKDWTYAKRWFGLYLAVFLLLFGLAYEPRIGRTNEFFLASLYLGGEVAFVWSEFILKRRIHRATNMTGTSRVMNLPVGDDAKLNDMVRFTEETEEGSWLSRFMHDPGPSRLSPFKILVFSLIAYLFAVHVALGMGDRLGREIKDHKQHRTAVVKIRHHVRSQGGHGNGGAVGGGGAGGGGAGGGGATQSIEWDCPTKPGFDAPKWASASLMRLYLGGPGSAGLRPGEKGGCTGKTLVPKKGHGNFVYVVGRDKTTGALLSVAVDSKRFGPQIYVAPAVGAVLGLIHAGEIVGGPDRITVGNGDLIVLESLRGLFALVRPQTVLPATGATARYVELGPAAVRAWASSMTSADHWLWPIGRHSYTRSSTVKLVDSALNPAATYDSVIFDPRGTWAYLRSGGPWFGDGLGESTPRSILRWTTSAG